MAVKRHQGPSLETGALLHWPIRFILGHGGWGCLCWWSLAGCDESVGSGYEEHPTSGRV